MCAFILNGCATTSSTDLPGVTVTEVESFTTVDQTINALNAQYGAENVLIVSDIDNTVLTSAGDLGGDIWYQWQRGKLNIKPTDSQKVSCLFEDTISLLYELGPMKLTEEQLPGLLNNWQNSGNTLLLLTSRAPKNRSATERELLRNQIDVAAAALAPISNNNPVYRKKLDREMSYSRGVMMTTGMNKGTMLKWILNQTQREFDAIVFVDDSYTNIENMHASWLQDAIDMRIFHYTHVEAQRIAQQGSVLTQAQANQMADDYARLMRTINSTFPARLNNGECLAR
ncbi:hypothetical protein BFC17_06415 [Alteromonas lipolytica]|uniref:DUF2608 domain-containing protein n=1 Tax=Alteromonas lipolytica TaxID=1856405 RepID=A0A1E8FA92_9ALTE|nr:hypothetical protein BFC17_06415 [Alteromonas lipolytica]